MLQDTITKAGPPIRWQDHAVPQCCEAFSAEDLAVWDLLFARQLELLGTRVVSAFLDGIDLLRLSHPGVPDVDGLNAILTPRTGWRVVAVPGLVPDAAFFAMLSERVFPVGNFIRSRAQLDYLEAPDCFLDMSAISRRWRTTVSPRWSSTSAGWAARRSPPARASGRPASIGTASSSAWSASTATWRSSAPASPRASARRISAWTAIRPSGCPSRSAGRCTRRTSMMPSSRYLVSASLEQTIAEVRALTPEQLLAL